jgi:AraC-like DNA-binding protein
MKQAKIIPLLKFQNGTSPFKVQTIKDFTEEQGEINDAPHSHNYYEIIWMINGNGTLYVDMHQYPIGDNTIFCLLPNQMHQFQMNMDMEGFVFSFTDSFFNLGEHEFEWECQASLAQLFSERHAVSILHELEADLKEITLKMKKEFENSYTFKMQLLKRYFRIFLIYLTRLQEERLPATGQTRDMELVKGFMEMLDKSFKEKKMVAEYAQQLCVTPNYLNRIIKKSTGYSASHHIQQRVVLEAKRLARFSDSGMKAIAYELGFLDSAHFSRFFKSVAGFNFSDFKKEGLYISMNVELNRA